MSPEQVRALVGEPVQWRGQPPSVVGYWSSGLSVHFAPGAEFIEIARGMELSPVLSDLLVFETPADHLIDALVALGHEFDTDTEGGHMFVFKTLQVGFWRGNIPEASEDPEGRFFDSVGVGRSGYYK
jgi:hypothetical protein